MLNPFSAQNALDDCAVKASEWNEVESLIFMSRKIMVVVGRIVRLLLKNSGSIPGLFNQKTRKIVFTPSLLDVQQ